MKQEDLTLDKKTFKGRRGKGIDESIEDLFDYTGVSRKIIKSLIGLDIDIKQQKLLLDSVEKEFTDERNRKSDEYKRIKENNRTLSGASYIR